jgi:3-methyladenine DNA glycosylase AlkD
MSVDFQSILTELESMKDDAAKEGMARYGITTDKAWGISVAPLRSMAKRIGKDHELAARLWNHGWREARLLAAMVEDPARVTEKQMDKWARALDSWDVCDGLCNDLFRLTPFAHAKAVAWSARPEPYVKRAGFVLMAVTAVHDKREPDGTFIEYLKLVEREAGDDRNAVKKAVNWALRQIGKRNHELHGRAIQTAEAIQKQDWKSAKWIASDALRELTTIEMKRRMRKPPPEPAVRRWKR